MMRKKQRDIPQTLSIRAYMHRAQCLEELPSGISPQSYQKIQARWTEQGFQVWCLNHNCNIIHVDFEGQSHPATTLTAKEAEAWKLL